MDNKKEKNPAHDWPTYIKQAIKTGLESPTPYKVIPYKNGIGIKKIEFNKLNTQSIESKDIKVDLKRLKAFDLT